MEGENKRYIDPMVDAAFKRIFGSEINKDLLIAFLNEIFQGRRYIIDLVYNKNEYPGEIAMEGGAIYDLTCTDQNGAQFLIEVQRGRQKYFKHKAIFYMSRLITSQAPKGRRKEWGYALSAVYLISILDHPINNGTAENYIHDVCLIDKNTKEIFYEELGYIIIDLCSFVKTEEELDGDLDRWLYLIKHLSKLDEMPETFNNPIFERLLAVSEYSNLTQKEKIMYDRSMKYKWDNKNVLDFAVNEGMEKGLAQGMDKGVELGKVQGNLEGRSEALAIVALKMKMQGYSVEIIQGLTHLSLAEIEQL